METLDDRPVEIVILFAVQEGDKNKRASSAFAKDCRTFGKREVYQRTEKSCFNRGIIYIIDTK